MSIDPQFISVEQTLDWADESISELDVICRKYFKDTPYSFSTELDPHTWLQHFKFHADFGNIPNMAIRRATEGIRHIKDSFDQTMFAARNIMIGHRSDIVYFPWAQNPVPDLEKRLTNPQIPSEIRNAISNVQPYGRGKAYPGGDDIVRALAQIGGKRKHTVHLSIEPDHSEIRQPTIISGKWVGAGGLRLPSNLWNSSKNELTIAIAPLGCKIYHDAGIVFSICFDEAPPLKGIPVVLASRQFLQRARTFTRVVKAVCKKHVST